MNIVKNTVDDILKEISTPKYTDLWKASKEKIDVCNICEFRHMCVDSAIPLKRKNGTLYREKECNYNPYISKWKGQKGYRNLANSGVTCNQFEFKMTHTVLKKTIASLWKNQKDYIHKLILPVK